MNEQPQEQRVGSPQHEYTEVTLYARHNASLRFVAFSIFFAVMGGVGFAAFGKDQFDANAAVVARISGFPVITIFWLYHERLTEFIDYYNGRRAELERLLGYGSRPVGGKSGFPRMHHTWRVFYFLVALLWLCGAFAVPLPN